MLILPADISTEAPAREAAGGSPHPFPSGASPPLLACPALTGYELALLLVDIGWTEREFARRSGQHPTQVRRQLERGVRDVTLAACLTRLAAFHRENPIGRGVGPAHQARRGQ